MKVGLKLFATLGRYLPGPARAASRTDLELAAGASLLDLIGVAGVPPEQCTLVLLNGAFVERAELAGKVLAEGDVVAIWPPVGGG